MIPVIVGVKCNVECYIGGSGRASLDFFDQRMKLKVHWKNRQIAGK